MNTTGLMVKLGLAGALLSALAPEARADLVSLGGHLDASTLVAPSVVTQSISRETPFSVDLDTGPYFSQQSSFGYSDYAGIPLYDDFFAESHSEWGASFDSTRDGYEFSTSMYSESMTIPYVGFTHSDTTTAATISMLFDRETELDVHLRIEYARWGTGFSPLGYVAGGFTVEGLVGAPGSEFMLEGPLDEEGVVEFSFRATAGAGQAFTLTSDGRTAYTAFSNVAYHGWGSLEMTASVQVVPAPGGVLVLGGLGLVAGRRRR